MPMFGRTIVSVQGPQHHILAHPGVDLLLGLEVQHPVQLEAPGAGRVVHSSTPPPFALVDVHRLRQATGSKESETV